MVKTMEISFSSPEKQGIKNWQELSKFFLHNDRQRWKQVGVQFVKDLGVIIDNKLPSSEHVN